MNHQMWYLFTTSIQQAFKDGILNTAETTEILSNLDIAYHEYLMAHDKCKCKHYIGCKCNR